MTKTMLFLAPITPGSCEWCGAPCLPEDTCCSVACEARLMKHEKDTARSVLRTLKLWRKHRGRKGTPGEGALTKLAAEVDALLQEDRRRRKLLGEQRQNQPEG